MMCYFHACQLFHQIPPNNPTAPSNQNPSSHSTLTAHEFGGAGGWASTVDVDEQLAPAPDTAIEGKIPDPLAPTHARTSSSPEKASPVPIYDEISHRPGNAPTSIRRDNEHQLQRLVEHAAKIAMDLLSIAMHITRMFHKGPNPL